MINQHPICQNLSKTITYFPEDKVVVRKAISGAIFYLGWIHIAVSLFLFFLFSNGGRIRHLAVRSRLLVIMIALAVIMHMFVGLAPKFLLTLPSWLNMVFILLLVPFTAFPIPVRLFGFYGRYAFSRAVAQAAISDNASSISNDDRDEENAKVDAGENEMTKKDNVGFGTQNEKRTFTKNEKDEGSDDTKDATEFPNQGTIAQTSDFGIEDLQRKKNISTRELMFLKFIASKEAQMLLVFLYISPYISVIIANLVLIPELNPIAGCFRSPVLTINKDVVVASGALAVIFGIFGALLVRKFEDPFGLATECRIYTQYGGLFAFISYLMDYSVSDIPLDFSFDYLLGLALHICLFVSTTYQVYIGLKKQNNGKFSIKIFKESLNDAIRNKNKMDNNQSNQISVLPLSSSSDSRNSKALDDSSSPQRLLEVLDKPKEVEGFEKFLIGEFSVEMLRMYLECRKWETSFYTISETARRARAKKIVTLFVEENSLFEVNLPDTTRAEIIQDCNNLSVPIQQELFKKSQHEMLLMMHGAFTRYVKKSLANE